MPVTGWVFHSMAKRPDWAMKSTTALNINELILFNMFGYPRNTLCCNVRM